MGSHKADGYNKARANFDQWHGRARQYVLDHKNQELLNLAFLLKHFMDELAAIHSPGALYVAPNTGSQLQKEVDYQRYPSPHHSPEP